MNFLRAPARAFGLVATVAMAIIAEGARAQDLPIVAVTAISDYPALVTCRDGVRDALKTAGYEDGKTIRFVHEAGDGSLASATAVARRLAERKPRAVVPISTPSARAVLRATIGTPIVFVAVTDPLGARLVQNLQKPGGLVTGVSDLAPVKKQIEMIRSLQPTATRIGLIYNPRETNSHTLANLMKAVAQTIPMTVAEARVGKSAGVEVAAQSLATAGKVVR